MPASLPSVKIPFNTWVDLYAKTGFTVGLPLKIHNIGSSEANLSESATEPTFSSGFDPIEPREYLTNSPGNVGAWAFSKTGTTLQVEMAGGFKPITGDTESSTSDFVTAFGELSVESLTPITQVNARHGLLTNILTVTDDLLSGTNSVVDEKFTCETGVSPSGLATILTLRQFSNRSGMGGVARFSTAYGAAVVDCNQVGGLITAETSFTFAYLGTSFGILTVRGGVDELQELTLTSISGAEDVTITIDDTPYIVSLSGAGTLEVDAYEIQLALNIAVPNYLFTSNEDQVVAQSVIPDTQGSFSYSSLGSSVGAWVQLAAGNEGVPSFTAQSSWNKNTRMVGDVNSILNPQLMNNYKIQLNGGVDFFIQDSDTKKYVLVHRISYANQDNLNNPAESTFRVGWLVRNVGNTTNVAIQGGYCSSFVEGVVYYDNAPQGKSNNQTIAADTGNSESVIILRNRISFGDKVNRSEALPLLVRASSQTSKFALFKMILNPTFSSPVNFQYINKDSSIVEFSLDNVVVTGGSEIGSATVESGSPAQLSFNTTKNRTTAVFPGSTIAIVVDIPSAGGTADCQANLTFQEDL